MKQFRERSFSSIRSSTAQDKWDHQEANKTDVDIILWLGSYLNYYHLVNKVWNESEEQRRLHLLKTSFPFKKYQIKVFSYTHTHICIHTLVVGITQAFWGCVCSYGNGDCVPVFDFWGSDDRIFLLRHLNHIWTLPSFETNIFSHHALKVMQKYKMDRLRVYVKVLEV